LLDVEYLVQGLQINHGVRHQRACRQYRRRWLLAARGLSPKSVRLRRPTFRVG
jgi:hypothetical protein